MNDIQPIETAYNGYRFRSRLEARWAVFLDALKIRWEYEPEGFTLMDGTRYLPDFRLPTFNGGMWAEVKPEGGDFSKAKQFCQESHQSIWLCEGPPDLRAWWYLEYESLEEAREYERQNRACIGSFGSPAEGPINDADLTWGVQAYNGIPNADQATGEDRMFAMPGYEDDDGRITGWNVDCLGDFFIAAVKASRGSRFEFGESGATKPKVFA